jgi:multiple sugar transport system substrate-binding protein
VNRIGFTWISTIGDTILDLRPGSAFLSALLLGLWAISCGQPSLNSTQPNSIQQETTVLESGKFDDVAINVLTLTQPLGATVEKRAAEFESLTGVNITVKSASYSELYETILSDLTTGTNQYDVVILTPNWMPDYIESGYLRDLTENVNNDPDLAWEDIAPFFREYGHVYDGKIYSVPIDGNYHIMYYRADLLSKAGFEPPDTWDEYLEISKYFKGKDLNDDGEPDYGSCLAKKPGNVTYWAMWSIAASMLQSQGTQQGIFFAPDTMEPMVNNAAFAKALDIYKATSAYGSPDELEWGLNDGRQAFIAGRCALALDHGDIGTLALSKSSKIKGKLGTAIMPGSTEVLDWETEELVACDKFTCPFAVDGVNHAPFAAAIGWAGAVNAAAANDVQSAGYHFISYISQPVRSNLDVTNGQSGLNPYRISQFSDSENWLTAGMTSEEARTYLGGIGGSINSPNVVLDLTIPQNYTYQRELLDEAVSDFLAGRISREQTMVQITQDWNALTNEIGRETQKASYRTSLGLD